MFNNLNLNIAARQFLFFNWFLLSKHMNSVLKLESFSQNILKRFIKIIQNVFWIDKSEI